MKKLPFKVSAKAARLIGRENVANADGAISELVKNTYDADASHCTICFLPRYSQTPEWISKNEYKWIVETHPNLQSAFRPSDDGDDSPENESDASGFVIIPDLDLLVRRNVEIALASMKDLWIVDDGDGMSSTAIEENWMVIGTNFKELNIKSGGGRTRTGAKGIGRFALDRLGVECELFSSQFSEGTTYRSFLTWKVDWNAFEGQGKVLDQVEAELDADEARFQSSIDHFVDCR